MAGRGGLVHAFVRRLATHPSVRASAERVLLREDAIVPFGRDLRFDPHTWVIKQTEYGFRIWVPLGERAIGRAILLDRYERETVAYLRTVVRAGMRVVDVGAGLGFFTALFARLVGPNGSVVACEPLAAAAEALEHTVTENGFTLRVSVQHVALDEQAGPVRVRHAPVTADAGAASLAPATAPPAGFVDEPVTARTLDDVVGEEPCRLLFLDAGGAEARILAGATAALTRDRPLVVAHLDPPRLLRVSGKTANDVLAAMAAHGYVARRLVGDILGDPLARYDAATPIRVVFGPS